MITDRLKGKVALVTGVSSALGTRIAEHLIQDGGMRVVGVSRRPPVSSDERLVSNHLATDLTDFDATMKMVKKVQADYGDISVLVHTAALNRNTLLLRSDPKGDIGDVLQTNITAPLMLTKHVLRLGGMMRLKEKGGGSVIFIGSTVGVYGNAGQIGYAASKGALDAVCKSLAKEYSGAMNVRFNVVAPGLIAGPGMGAELGADAQRLWAETSCMKKLVSVEDVAESVLFLASNKMINGHTLVVDGCHQ